MRPSVRFVARGRPANSWNDLVSLLRMHEREELGCSRRRFLALVGWLSTSTLLALGVRPSIHTLAALVALPAPLLFLAALSRPSLLDRRWLSGYLTVCGTAAAFSIALQVVWLAWRG